jgi:hypothetical protein
MFLWCIQLINLAEKYFGRRFICGFGPENLKPDDSDDDYDYEEEEEEVKRKRKGKNEVEIRW